MNIEIKNVKINKAFSEETICFIADVFVNGVKTAYAKNDGRGGNTFYNAYEGKRDLLAKAEEYAKTLPSKKYGTLEIKSDLETIIDEAIDYKFNEGEKAKFKKKLDKDMDKNICFGVPNGNSYRMIGYKHPLKAIVLTTQGRDSVTKLIARVKTELKPSEEILNTNLKELGF